MLSWNRTGLHPYDISIPMGFQLVKENDNSEEFHNNQERVNSNNHRKGQININGKILTPEWFKGILYIYIC